MFKESINKGTFRESKVVVTGPVGNPELNLVHNRIHVLPIDNESS